MTTTQLLKEQRIAQWQGCYGESWDPELLTPEAFSHPAKFSKALISRIITYMLERGYIQPGQTILDPFGGVALGAVASFYGLNWIGVELEQKFCDIGAGCQCTGLSPQDYRRFYARFRPEAIHKINYKDGRHFCPACMAALGKVEETPARPLSYSSKKRRARIADLQKRIGKRLGRAVVLIDPLPFPEKYRRPQSTTGSLFDEPDASSPVYLRGSGKIPTVAPHTYEGNLSRFKKYAQPGTTARLIQGDSRRLRARLSEIMDGAVSSPPYSNGCAHTGGTDPNPKHIQGGKQGVYGVEAGYGDSTGQLGAMPPGSLDAAVSSPPYANSLNSGEGPGARYDFKSHSPENAVKQTSMANYGRSADNLGNLPEGSLADSLVTSPPFAGNTGGRGEASRNGIDAALFDRHSGGMKRGTGDSEENLDHLPMRGFDAAVGSPPYISSLKQEGEFREVGSPGFTGLKAMSDGYSKSPDNLGNMSPGGFDAALSSPPFADSVGSDSPEKRGGLLKSDPRRAGDRNLTGSYGESDGQLGAMKAGFDGAVTSPPFESSLESKDTSFNGVARPGRTIQCSDYGKTDGQLGIEQGQTFWAAARQIVTESFLALKPGAVSVWVCKKFVRDGAIVDFPGQWQQLCEAVGFEYIETIRAMLVTPEVQQGDFDGGSKKIQKAKKSFFRRLAEKNGSPAIDFEEVVILRKPLTDN